MREPLEVTFRDVQKTPDLENLIRREADKLDRVYPNLIRCRVAVEKPHEHQRTGNPYRVRLEMSAPGSPQLAITREPGDEDMHTPLEVVLKNAFSAARKRLKKLSEKQRGEVKMHPQQQMIAYVEELFPDRDYGFLRTIDGDQIYFHRNSVLEGNFDRLEIGTGVNFTSEQGQQGPQATSVRIVDKPGSRIPGESSY